MLVIQRPTVEQIDDGQSSRGSFAIGPLEPGFGHTLGASLRRTLLSSIPGSAVTSVKFDDALHEFDTMAGVVEDVTDVILNLKDIVLSCDSEEPVVVRIDKKGPGEVTAADIVLPPEVEVLNPELHIATLAESGRVACDLTIGRGRGWLSSIKRPAESATIGVIPVDAIFSPVRRVAISVEPTRVEMSTDFDKLVLDIETDGSMSPADALASAGSTVRSLMELVENMSEEPEGLTLGEAPSAASGSPDMELTIEELDLSERPRNCLKRAQINTVGELLTRSYDDLLAITNFGQKSLDEVVDKLVERGLSLRGGRI